MTVASLLLAPRAERRAPSQPPNPQPPSGLGPEKDLACKTAPQWAPRPTARTASKPARTQDSLEMARPRFELGTPRFSGIRKGRRLRRKSLQIGGSVRDRRNAHPRGYRRLQAGLGPRRAVEVLYARQHRLVEPRRMTRVRKAPAVRAPGRHKRPHCPARRTPSVRRRALPSSSISSARPGAAATLASRRKQAAGCDGRFGNPDAAQIDRLVSRLQ